MYTRFLHVLSLFLAAPLWAQSISGTVYTDQGSTNIGAGKTISISINGAAVAGSADTDASGAYVISGLTLNNGDVVTAFIDDEPEDGVTLSVVDGTAPTNFNIYQNTLILRHDNGGSLTHADLGVGDDVGDGDVLFSESGGNVTVSGHLSVQGNYSPGSNTMSVGGDFRFVSGTFTPGTSTINLTAGGALVPNGQNFYNLTINAAVGQSVQPSSSINVLNDFTLTSGTYNTGLRNLTVAGNFEVADNGVFRIRPTDTLSFGSYVLSSGSTIRYEFGSAGVNPKHALFGYNYPGNLILSGYQETLPDLAFTVGGSLRVEFGTLLFDDDKDLIVGELDVHRASVRNFGTGDLVVSSQITLSFSCSLIFDSAGTADTIQLRSATPGTPINMSVSGFSNHVRFVDVDFQDITSASAVYAASSTDSGNNTNIIFNNGVTVSGTVYSDRGVNNIGAGRSVSVALSASPQVFITVVTDAAGDYSIPNVPVGAADRLIVFLDDNAESGATILKSSSNTSVPANIDIYQDHVVFGGTEGINYRGDLLIEIDNSGDTDITDLFSTTSDGFTFTNGISVYIPPGSLFGTDVLFSVGTSGDTSDFIVDGTFAGERNGPQNVRIFGDLIVNGVYEQDHFHANQVGNHPLYITGDLTNNSGAALNVPQPLALQGTNQTINDPFTSYAAIVSDTQAKVVTVTGSLTASGGLTNSANLTLNGGSVHVGGSVVNSAVLNGTATLEIAGTGPTNFDPGTSFDIDTIVSRTNASDVLELDRNLTLSTANLTIREGVLNAQSFNVVAPNTFEIEAGGQFRTSIGSTFSPFTTQAGSSVRYDVGSNSLVPSTVTAFSGDLDFEFTGASEATLPDFDFIVAGRVAISGTGSLVLDDDKSVTANELRVFSNGSLVSTGTGDITLGAGGIQNDGVLTLNSSGGTVFGGEVDGIQIRSSTPTLQRSWSGAGSFTLVDVDLQDQNNITGSTITAVSSTDSGNNTNFAFSASVLTGGGVALADTTVGVNTAATLSFTTTNPVPVDGRIKVTFPAGFDVSGVTGATSSDIDGTLSLQGVSGQEVVFVRSGGTALTGGSSVTDLLISGVINPGTTGVTGSFSLATTDNADGSIDSGITPGVTITDPPVLGYQISGTVFLSNLDSTAIQGVTVSAGGVSTTTDASGNYVLSNVQEDEVVRVVTDEYRIDSGSIAEFIVGSSDAANVNFVLTPSLAKTSYSGWNTFLDMTAVLELSNYGTTVQSFQVTFFDATGSEITNVVLQLAAGEKRDVILNDLLMIDSEYGLVRVKSATNEYFGQVSHYRSNSLGDIEFAYAVNLSGGVVGYSAAGYNINQPSANPEDQDFVVTNWLSIMNVSDSTQSYQLERYLSDGTLVLDEYFMVPPKGRLDLEGAHLEGVGAGINIITPLDPTGRYVAFLTRYGDKGGENAGYYFASSSLFAKPSTTSHYASLGEEYTWLEISNVSDDLEEVSLEVLAGDGTKLHSETFGLPGKTQRHFDVSALMEAYSSGYVRIVTASSSRVLVEVAKYAEQASGSVSGVNVSAAGEVFGRSQNTSFNSFLNTLNKLSLSNISTSIQEVTVSSSGFASIVVSLAPGETQVVELPVQSDNYGDISVFFTTSGGVLSELVRDASTEFLMISKVK